MCALFFLSWLREACMTCKVEKSVVFRLVLTNGVHLRVDTHNLVSL